MSFSGVFRYSKNGYNVPIKSNFKDKKINIEKEWIKSLDRFNKLNPIVTNLSYEKVNIPNIKDAVIILDPPYEGSQANYNILTFDYHFY
jgi:site-specific DNA-adenine methylase